MGIKKYSDRLDDILDVNQEVEWVTEGSGGDQGPTEGPLWWHEDSALVFSDIHNNRRITWKEGEEAKVLQDVDEMVDCNDTKALILLIKIEGIGEIAKHVTRKSGCSCA